VAGPQSQSTMLLRATEARLTTGSKGISPHHRDMARATFLANAGGVGLVIVRQASAQNLTTSGDGLYHASGKSHPDQQHRHCHHDLYSAQRAFLQHTPADERADERANCTHDDRRDYLLRLGARWLDMKLVPYTISRMASTMTADTTPVAPEVAEAMLPFLRAQFGNPSSSHVQGQHASD